MNSSHPHTIIYVGAAVFTTGVLFTLLSLQHFGRKTSSTSRKDDEYYDYGRCGPPRIVDGIEGCIGNTPLLRIKSLSEATGCEILAKAEVSTYCAPWVREQFVVDY